ncbi:HAD-IA family hydrolase [Pseudonocardia nantongensis]|uniref:HAD-IA family hydrolase n=1 Tax=Pseudonocardia nantongensis TaxID=1181885 RepID=UPI00397D4F95
MIVTFDLFSALTDSRAGASAAFAGIAAERGWSLTGEELYDVWDRHNKQAQRTARADRWVSFRALSRHALAAAYAELGLGADPYADLNRVQDVASWPLWPDVADGVRAVAQRARVGILSNVDDDLAAATRAYRLVEPDLVLTSQRLGAYKPHPEIYQRAREHAGELVHVAASARDVRGALDAGIATVRLVRPGHRLDPAGPVPDVEVSDARDLPAALDRLG